jgi:hypothetical protein
MHSGVTSKSRAAVQTVLFNVDVSEHYRTEGSFTLWTEYACSARHLVAGDRHPPRAMTPPSYSECNGYHEFLRRTYSASDSSPSAGPTLFYFSDRVARLGLDGAFTRVVVRRCFLDGTCMHRSPSRDVSRSLYSALRGQAQINSHLNLSCAAAVQSEADRRANASVAGLIRP